MAIIVNTVGELVDILSTYPRDEAVHLYDTTDHSLLTNIYVYEDAYMDKETMKDIKTVVLEPYGSK